MRVLFITNYPKLYGANRSLLSLMSCFDQRGEEICLLIPHKGGMTEELDKIGMNRIVIPYMSSIFYYKNYHSIKKSIGKPLLVLATLFMLPYIIYRVWRYDPDLIYSNSAADNLGIIIAKVLKKKHITHIRDFMDLDHGYKFIFGNKARKNFINKSNGVIYVSQSVADHTQLGSPLPINHKVIYNGVKVNPFDYKYKVLSEHINMGIVGLLDESKGQHLAIAYFKSVLNNYPCAVLHIWGDKESPYKYRLLDLVNELGIKENVFFHGFENNTDIIYNKMDVLLMFSRMEGFGRVTVEAMQKGIPVIGYNAGGTAELIQNGYNGFLFNDMDGFEKAVSQLFVSDDEYNRICHQAYIDARVKFSEGIYTKKVYDFVNLVMRQN